ncbi:hypothetical protein [Streptomyces buecherae]|uniref:hypothetical protein n=1 Tax=Streptomyces buecherae TaxID=2763006 RepID=UPI0037BD615B
MIDRSRVTEAIALAGLLLSISEAIHPLGDQLLQSSADAKAKDMRGRHLVYRADGTPVDERPQPPGDQARTCTASAYGRQAVRRHVTSYTAAQLATAIAVTRALGYRVPTHALLAGAAITATTHAIIDRRAPLLWLAKKARKDGYIAHATVVRRIDPEHGPVVDTSGPGTALMEIDQAVHRAINIVTAATTTWLALRRTR